MHGLGKPDTKLRRVPCSARTHAWMFRGLRVLHAAYTRDYRDGLRSFPKGSAFFPGCARRAVISVMRPIRVMRWPEGLRVAVRDDFRCVSGHRLGRKGEEALEAEVQIERLLYRLLRLFLFGFGLRSAVFASLAARILLKLAGVRKLLRPFLVPVRRLHPGRVSGPGLANLDLVGLLATIRRIANPPGPFVVRFEGQLALLPASRTDCSATASSAATRSPVARSS